MPHSRLPDKEFHQTLPKKRIASGALFFNDEGEILLVETSYKPTWEIPGGVGEANESPLETCQREILEEIGRAERVGRLLVVDYLPENENRLEIILFIFAGGVLSDQEISKIKIDLDEIISFNFFTLGEAKEITSDDLFKRIKQAVEAFKKEVFYYLEEGGI